MSEIPDEPRNPQMPTTRWTLIARLRSGDDAEAHRAVDELCQAYHYPLYCQIRRRGLSHHDAEDALHDFLAKLLRNDTFGVAESEKGRLRTFLLMALQRFLSNWHRDRNRRRSFEFDPASPDYLSSAQERYLKDTVAMEESPDRLFDRQWARELMGLTVNRLRGQYLRKDRGALFEALLPVLLSGGSLLDHDSERLARDLGMKTGTVRVALHRLLADYRHALREEVLQTVGDLEQAREELEHLMSAFSSE